MEVVYIVPIGGALAAIGVLIVLGVIWLWDTATEYENALIDFANESSDDVLLIVAIVIAAIGIIFMIIKYCNVVPLRIRDKTKTVYPIILEALVKLILFVAPFLLGVLAIYGWSVFWINGMIETVAESVLMWISVPLMFIVYLFGVVVGVLPMLGLLFLEFVMCDDDDGDNVVVRFLIPSLLEVVGCALYVFLIYTCTDLPTYLSNSFA